MSALTRLAEKVKAGTHAEHPLVIGVDLARGNDSSAEWEAHPAGTAARIAELETLLARALVMDPHAAEDGLEALGGWGRVFDLVTAYREANPLPAHDLESATGIDGDVAF
jgi:hypothetical protein